jgi:hypothetical protein
MYASRYHPSAGATRATTQGHWAFLGPVELTGSLVSTMAMKLEDKKRLMADLLHIAEETRRFKPPYIPSRYVEDLANSDPAELVLRYVLAKDPTDGFQRLWLERRLDLSVENIAWKHRHAFPPRVAKAAASRLAEAGFDVKTQTQK